MKYYNQLLKRPGRPFEIERVHCKLVCSHVISECWPIKVLKARGEPMMKVFKSLSRNLWLWSFRQRNFLLCTVDQQD